MRVHAVAHFSDPPASAEILVASSKYPRKRQLIRQARQVGVDAAKLEMRPARIVQRQ